MSHSHGPLKVLMVAATPYFSDRGCHVRIQGEARALEARGHDVVIATYGLGRDVEGGRIVRASGLPGYHRVDAAPTLGKVALDLFLLLRAARLGRDERPDIVHAHTQEGGLIGLLLARSLGIPVVLDLQSRSVAEELLAYRVSRDRSPLYHFAMGFDRALPRSADAVVTATGAIARFVATEAPPAGPLEVLGDAIDVPDPVPSPDPDLRRAVGLDPRLQTVVYLGLLTHTQGIDILIEAAARLVNAGRPCQFLVMGYPDEDQWRRSAEQHGLGHRMFFTGRVPFEEAPRYLALGDLAVSPKRDTVEGNGKLLLYMSCGLASVALDTPTNREVLGDAGIYVPDDAARLAESIAALLADPGERARRGGSLRERARAHASWDSRARQLERIYTNLIERSAVC